MSGRGLILLTLLSGCVLSLPQPLSQLHHEDVELMRCIVEALADVLSKPRAVPVSQECLVRLKTDSRLTVILRHHNFLKELQQIAAADEQADASTATTQVRHLADQSMLKALGGPGEMSMLSQRKRAGKGDRGVKKEGHMKEKESQEGGGKMNVTGERGDWSDEEKHPNSSLSRSDEEAMDTRSELLSQTHSSTNGGEDMKEELAESLGRWTNGARSLDLNKKAAGKDLRQKEVTQHSREAAGKEKGEEERKRDAQRGPDRVLQFVHGAPEKKRVMEEEGSASRKSEEIESLAAIESELEDAAQKLHELRQG
ncbi:chromogranin-A isoform X2 [Oryzias latipes]|uniref:chromogranin-A isoform X2 n=1 Tax=Oryzias latipes TaxID=8090 RepID=UPI0002A49E74|nr:chromogranin-A isoform X2 [Oryzias latipes]